MPWSAVGLAIIAGSLVVGYAAFRADPPDPGKVVEALRSAALFLAIAAGFVIDDPAAVTVQSTPFRLRRSMRISLFVWVATPAWLLLCGIAMLGSDQIPVAALSGELATLTALSLASAAALLHAGRFPAGPFVAPGMLLFRWFSSILPPRWTLWGGGPGTPMWEDAHLRFAVIAFAALIVLALFSRDPASAYISTRIREPKRSPRTTR